MGFTQVSPSVAQDQLVTGGFKNKIINGNFDIWQRGTEQTNNGYGSADRWVVNATGSSFVSSREVFALGQTGVPGNPKFFYRIDVTSVTGADNFVALRQRIESVRTLAGRTATFSFYAKSDAPRNVGITLAQVFGGGGTPSDMNRSFYQELVALTTEWQRFTLQIDVPSIAWKTLGTDGTDRLTVSFCFDAGANYDDYMASIGHQTGTFDIAQVQLEEGPVATPFEQRHIGQELALCQRYYEKSYPLAYAPGSAITAGALSWESVNTHCENLQVVRFAAVKRGTPAITIYSTDTGASGVFYVNGLGDISPSIRCGSTTGFSLGHPTADYGIKNFYAHYTADAEL